MAFSIFTFPAKHLAGHFLPEYIIRGVYEHALLRSPSKSEILFWTPFVKKNGIVAFVKQIQLSPEKITLTAKVESHRILFMHIPRTAGTSFRVFFERLTNKVFIVGEDQDHILLNEATLVLGHFGFAYMKHRAYTLSFTILRDPIERIISFYRYRYGLSGVHGWSFDNSQKKPSFEQWILSEDPQVKSLIDSYYVRIMTDDMEDPFENRVSDSLELAYKRYSNFSAIGDQSNMEPFYKKISSLLDIPSFLLPIVNVSSTHTFLNPKYTTLPKVSPNMRTRLEELTRYDFEIYNRFRCK
jgi:hypothetical protein